jgi:hypothetical protein
MKRIFNLAQALDFLASLSSSRSYGTPASEPHPGSWTEAKAPQAPFVSSGDEIADLRRIFAAALEAEFEKYDPKRDGEPSAKKVSPKKANASRKKSAGKNPEATE